MSVFEPCIYYWENKINGKVYIGKANDFNERTKEHIYLANTNPKYPIDCAIKKYGIDNFEIKIISFFCTAKEALLAEIEWIAEMRNYIGRDNVYNITDGGEGALGYKHTAETIQKMSGKNHHLFGKKMPREQVEKIRKNNVGRVVSNDTRKKISIANIGKIVSKETRDKLSNIFTGRELNQDIKNKISVKNSGENNPSAKLNWKKVNEIRELLKNGIKHKDIAIKFGVKTSTISNISINKNWKINDKEYQLFRNECKKFNSHASKLTVDKVNEIKKLIIDGKSTKELSKKFNVSLSTIRNIKHNRTWTKFSKIILYPSKPKLTQENVNEIRLLLSSGTTPKDLMKKFNLSKSAISHIKHNRTWKDDNYIIPLSKKHNKIKKLN
jgi:group I intron endonuclease